MLRNTLAGSKTVVSISRNHPVGKSEILESPGNVDYGVAKTLRSRMKWSLPLCGRYAFLAKKFILMEMREKDGWEERGD